MKILVELIKEEKLLELRLEQIRRLKNLYIGEYAESPVKYTVKDIVLDVLNKIGESDIETIAKHLDKSTKTIDNLLRTLVKEERIEVRKEGKKNIYKVK